MPIPMVTQNEIDAFMSLIDPDGSHGFHSCVRIKDDHLLFEEDTLHIKDNTKLEMLPKNLEIYSYFGDLPALEVVRCPRFRMLEHIRISTNSVSIEECEQFFGIGSGVVIDSGLNLSNLPSLEYIAEAIQIGSLDINNAPRLRQIPALKNMDGSLSLKNCPTIEELPNDLMNQRIRGQLMLTDCSRINKLPEKLWVMNSVHIKECHSLQKLPVELIIGGSLYITNNSMLQVLPERLVVKRDMLLIGCPVITFPKRIEILGDMYIHPNAHEELLQQVHVWKENGMLRGNIVFST